VVLSVLCVCDTHSAGFCPTRTVGVEESAAAAGGAWLGVELGDERGGRRGGLVGQRRGRAGAVGRSSVDNIGRGSSGRVLSDSA
jgi:hypothetical protein